MLTITIRRITDSIYSPVEERSRELIAEELALPGLRNARKQTQTGSVDTAC